MAIEFIPAEFTVGGTAGSLESWPAFSRWYRGLIEDRDQLPVELYGFVKKIQHDTGSVAGQIQQLVRFVQEKTRYVAIQLNLSSWQPQTVADVYANRYGDCKDLSLFTTALLNAAGITAYPALIKTENRGDIDPDIPSPGFDHCIVFAETGDDTLWIETTSDHIQAGDLTASCQGVYALVVKKDGGELLKTPVMPADRNRSVCRIDGSWLNGRDLQIRGELCLSGIPAAEVRSLWATLSPQEQRAWFGERYLSHLAPEIRNLQLQARDLHALSSRPACIAFQAELIRFAKKSSRRLFLPVRCPHHRQAVSVPRRQHKSMPLYMGCTYTHIDTVRIDLPADMSIEAMAQNYHFDTDFTGFDFFVRAGQKQCTIIRRESIRRKSLPPESYQAFQEWTKTMVEADDQKIVLVH